MTVRRLLLSVAFLGGAVLLTASGPVRAQDMRFRPNTPGTHEVWGRTLTPEEIKRALEHLSKGDEFPPDLPREVQDLLKNKLQPQDGKVDEKQLKAVLDRMQKDPAFRKQVEALAKSMQKSKSGQPSAIDQAKLREMLKDVTGPQAGVPKNDIEFPQDQKGTDFQEPGKNAAQPKTKITPPAVENPNPKGGNERPDLAPPNVPPDAQNVPPERGGDNPLPMPGDDAAAPPSPFDPNETPRERSMRTFASLWERNVGPLDDTPAVKKALFELVEGTEDIKDAEGNSFWDTISKETGDSTSLADFIDSAALGDSWKMPKFDMPSFNWSKSDPDIGRSGGSNSSGDSWWNRRSSSSNRGGPSGSGGFGGFSIPGLEGSWLPIVILAILLLGALIAWKVWGWKSAETGRPFGLGGLGAWPIDPQKISTRQHVVLAFEYLSVLICGPSAKTWTHNTIAQALADLATTHGETATMLARLYELARYAPLEEPLTAAEVAEARRLVCRLAGLEYE